MAFRPTTIQLHRVAETGTHAASGTESRKRHSPEGGEAPLWCTAEGGEKVSCPLLGDIRVPSPGGGAKHLFGAPPKAAPTCPVVLSTSGDIRVSPSPPRGGARPRESRDRALSAKAQRVYGDRAAEEYVLTQAACSTFQHSLGPPLGPSRGPCGCLDPKRSSSLEVQAPGGPSGLSSNPSL